MILPITFDVDITKPLLPTQLPQMLVEGDSEANQITVRLYQGGEPYYPGGTCAGKVLRVDGQTVGITGTVSGNELSILLPATAYARHGAATISITSVVGDSKATVFLGLCSLYRAQSETAVDPGDIIPSVTDLIASIAAAEATIPADYTALLATIAPNYSDLSAPIYAGAFCWNEGVLYQAVADITVAETWTAAHWRTVTIEEILNAETLDIENIKTAFGVTKSVTTVFRGFTSDANYTAILSTMPYVLVKSLTESRIINGIKLTINTGGRLTIGVYPRSGATAGTTFVPENAVAKRVLRFSGPGVFDVEFPGFELDTSHYLFIGADGDTAKFMYGGTGATDAGFLWKNSTTSAFTSSSNFIGVDVKSIAYQSTVAQKTDEMDQFIHNEITYRPAYESFTSDGTWSASIVTRPFVCPKAIQGSRMIGGIRLNISTPGTLTIGVYPRSSAATGETVDASLMEEKAVLTFEEEGEATQYFVPFELDESHYLFIGKTTDTAKFMYGGTGATDTGFLYLSTTTGKFVSSVNALGVDLLEIMPNLRRAIQSAYHGKKLSILGDSISTFDGFIPSANTSYYPQDDVQAVTDTWWKKLMDALGLVLDTNNSWSGSRVSTTNGETSAGCMTRCQNLGSPDVIIVWMGINDFNNEVPLGNYDGSTSVPSTTTTFREAYGIMLGKILTAYPTAEVWVCTLPQCERNASTGFPEINGDGTPLIAFNKAILELATAFGVKVLDHNRCGLTYQNMDVYNPNELHPNKYGHSLIANADIRTMDNAVSKRYPIS